MSVLDQCLTLHHAPIASVAQPPDSGMSRSDNLPTATAARQDRRSIQEPKHEILQSVRQPGDPAHSRGRFTPAFCLRQLSRHSLPEPQHRRRLRRDLGHPGAAVPPRHRAAPGYWTLPAGFMENGETIEQAAIRETAEEACARVRNLSIYTLIDVPHISQVHVFFRAELGGPGFCRRYREPGGATIRRSRHPLGRAGFPHGGPYLRMLLR